uniref:Serine protease n=1 Tax=Craspedostauros australis TaxID=1486917 RepID=A0A7R9WP60_9STRA|mmetsp:Transcript_1427/g.3962  ORF Transcript_1427/g.3962 Transcript_1427/m.3962 type:complete len:114 (+) Transcript_1427:3-344(+)
MASSLVDGRVRHGEFVLAVGAPLSLESSVTVGIVSNPDRNVGVHRYIQTDAAVHIGNSGGPLANIHGQIIGINSIKVAEGITYAIPIHEAIETIRKSMRNQTNGSASLSIPQP